LELNQHRGDLHNHPEIQDQLWITFLTLLMTGLLPLLQLLLLPDLFLRELLSTRDQLQDLLDLPILDHLILIQSLKDSH
jgi:hypothetical protein